MVMLDILIDFPYPIDYSVKPGEVAADTHRPFMTLGVSTSCWLYQSGGLAAEGYMEVPIFYLPP